MSPGRQREGSTIRRVLGYLMRLGVAAFGIALVVTSAPTLPEAWRADRGGGTPGVFVAEWTSCGRKSCRTYGPWTSTNGSLAYQRTNLPRKIKPGERVPAVAFPKSGEQRIYEPGRHNTVDHLLWIVLGLVMVVVGVYNLNPTSRRSPPPTPARR